MTYTNLNNTQISFDLPEPEFSLNYRKNTQMTIENSEGMNDICTSSVSHVSRKPLQCIQVTTPYAGHVVEVTFRSHYGAYDLFSNITRLSSSLFSSGDSKNPYERKMLQCSLSTIW